MAVSGGGHWRGGGVMAGAAPVGRGPLVAVLFFAGTLGPALGFINVYPMRYSFVADHFQYLASIGPDRAGSGGNQRSALAEGNRFSNRCFAGRYC